MQLFDHVQDLCKHHNQLMRRGAGTSGSLTIVSEEIYYNVLCLRCMLLHDYRSWTLMTMFLNHIALLIVRITIVTILNV